MTDNSCPMPKYSSLSRKRKSKPLVRVGKLGIVRLTGKAIEQLRRDCFERDGGICQECGRRIYFPVHHSYPISYHMAHIKGRGAGGSDTLDNVRALCGDCHRAEHGNPTEHTKRTEGMNEFQETKHLADKLLDEPNADPDDSLRMLSRQFLRAVEREDKLVNLLTNTAQILDVVKQEWAEAWSAFDQEQRDEITKFLTYYHGRMKSHTKGLRG